MQNVCRVHHFSYTSRQSCSTAEKFCKQLGNKHIGTYQMWNASLGAICHWT